MTLTVTADPTGLAVGTYSGVITITAANGDRIQVPVTITGSAISKAILLSQAGLAFTAVAQGGVVPPQSIAVINPGTGALNWQASASTLPANLKWLRVSPASGTTDAAQPAPEVTASVDPTGLAPGCYYGLARIDAPDAANSPQVVTIFLEVLPAGSDPAAVITPAEATISVPAGPNPPPSQEFFIYGLGAGEKTFRVTASTTFGSAPTLAPGSGVLSPDRPTRVLLQYNSSRNTPGRYPQVLTFQFSDGRVRTVSTTLIVAPTAASPTSADTREPSARFANGQCEPTQLGAIYANQDQMQLARQYWSQAVNVDAASESGIKAQNGLQQIGPASVSLPVSLLPRP